MSADSEPRKSSADDAEETGETRASDDAESEVAGVEASEVVAYLQWGALAFAALAVLVAGVGFYTSVSRIIAVWVSQPYQPVFRAGFNLLVLLVAGGAVAWLARRLA